MLEYLFDSDYKAAKSKYDTANSKRNKLIKIKQDITNDSSSINTINHNLDYIYEDFAKKQKRKFKTYGPSSLCVRVL